MKKFLNFGPKSKTTAPETIQKPAYNWKQGPAYVSDGDIYFDWSPQYRLLWIRSRPTSIPEQPRSTMHQVTNFIEQALAPEAVNCTVNVVCDNADGMFPASVIISVKSGTIVLESSCFCKPGDLDARTMSKITTVIHALGYDETKFQGILKEWHDRYNRIVKDATAFSPFDVRLHSTIDR